ncbi:MAG TPA: MFS transporter [Thermoanaerobaculia bacterium]|nr:MFS transporter [Thermoanaerobaculia bacterium]
MPTLRENLKALPRPAWILFAGTFINRFGTFVMPFLVIYLTRRGYGMAESGAAVSAYGGGHLVASMLGGHLADRIGRRNTIVLSMFASSISMLALSQATAYGTILILTFFAGASAEMYRPAATALIGDLVRPDQRIAAFGMYRWAVNLGFAAGPATAGFLATKSFFYVFAGDAATSALFGVIAFTSLPHGLRSSMKDEQTGEAFVHAIRNRRFVLFLLATLCVTWIEFQLHSTFPLYIQQLGFTTTTYGLLLSINGVMIVVFELMLTTWTQRFDPQKIIALGYALAAIGIAMTGLAHTIIELAGTVVVWTLGEMVYAPVTGAYVTSLAPERYRGRYSGMWILMWSMGMLLGPLLGTLIFQRRPAVLWMTCAIVGLAGAGLSLVKPSQPEQNTPECREAQSSSS